ncbi:MAG: hypothetical protein ABL956_01155 [Hyphomonadaceae bacterium]
MKYSSILASAMFVLAAAPGALAQAEPAYQQPKTSWGAPDLQGYWSTASLTTMTRPAGATSLIVSEEERQKLFNGNIYTRVAKEEAALSPAELLKDANPDRAYNRFWMDPGADLGKINGQYRSSWIVEPANGQIPFIDANAANRRGLSSSEEEYADRPSDNPEDRGVSERCIWFGSSAGPVLSNGMYNNNIQIVQTPDHVMIMGEMIHDVRVVSLKGERNPASIPKWGGDSIGHYEGNTLVVETINVEQKQGSFISNKGKVTERFTRASDGQIIYQYTVDDPSRYTQPWKGEMPLNVSQGLYEYACLEGNYSMFNLLSGARAYEREGRTNGVRKAIFAGVAEAKE